MNLNLNLNLSPSLIIVLDYQHRIYPTFNKYRISIDTKIGIVSKMRYFKPHKRPKTILLPES